MCPATQVFDSAQIKYSNRVLTIVQELANEPMSIFLKPKRGLHAKQQRNSTNNSRHLSHPNKEPKKATELKANILTDNQSTSLYKMYDRPLLGI
eukprot:scaffold660197_cov62-Prasinocladus_malaysianus.AAC.2